MRSRAQVTGALFIASSAMLFASKGILAKALYARGVGFELLVVVRAVLSLPLFWVFALASEGREAVRDTPRAAIAGAAVAGMLSYYGGAMLDFYALTLIDASVERVLLFSYPTLVVLFTAVQRRALPNRTVVMAVLLTYVGIFLAVGGFDMAALSRNYTGAVFVLLAAVTTASYFMIGERYTRQIGSARFTFFAMTASTVPLVLHFLLRRSPLELLALTVSDWLWLGALSVACLFVPALLQAEGVRRVGAQVGSVVSTVGPPTTILLAWLFLSESLSGWQILGSGLILFGILVLDLTPSGARRT